MRITVDLDPDVEAFVRRLMRERAVTLSEALNGAIREGIRDGGKERYVLPTRDMGEPRVDITKALQLAGEFEDEEQIRRLAPGS